ncbi:hypothetical protein [Halomarina litorea]|uniref:hypothetical protein n=1 Tax=Halomarina litorea TaxID=2961595 RepID=UPI0020C3AA25|nr:hypothetical protein [Halomarina sp. BCD28]
MVPSTHRSTTAPVESRWWLAIAAAAVFWVLAYVVGALLFLTAFAGFLGGVAGWPLGHFGGPGPAGFFPVGFGFVLLVVIPLALLGLALGLLLPVALYLDAEAVGRANVGWDPDPVLYAIVGVVGLFAQGVPVQPAVALYYLYRRHQHVGTP